MLRVVELCAGIGTQSLALTMEGIEHVSVISEIDPRAVATYRAINGPAENLGDLRTVARLPDHDLLTYSFPCQSLSMAGRRDGMAEGSGTASSLVWEVGRLLRDMRERERPLPEVLLMENVDAILNEGNRPEFDRWLAVLDDLGYTSVWKVLDAADYGVPQHRERCFVVSMTRRRVFHFPDPCPDGRVLADVLEDDVPETYYLTPERIESYERHRIRQVRAGRGHGWRPSMPAETAPTVLTAPTKGSTMTVVMAGDLHAYQYEMMNRVYATTGASPTITTCQGGGHVPRVEVGDLRIRYLTERECWRLMGIPDAAFDAARDVPTSRTQLYKQAGNAIAVPCLRAIFRAIYIRRAWHTMPALETWGARTPTRSRIE